VARLWPQCGRLSVVKRSFAHMTDSPAPLDWFHALPIDDRLALLRDPYGGLSVALISRLPSGLVASAGVFTAQHSSSPPKGRLSGSAAMQLEDQREQLLRDLDADGSGQS
jgi:hypothetical protein